MLINVELPGSGQITQMDDSLLFKKEYVMDTAIDTWNIVEYYDNPEFKLPWHHRSAHMIVNKQTRAA